MPEIASATTNLDLINFLKAIPGGRMRRGMRIPAWFLLLVAVLGILSMCESHRDLERFGRRHHGDLPMPWASSSNGHPLIRLFATSSSRWTSTPSETPSGIGRSPRSPVAQLISTS